MKMIRCFFIILFCCFIPSWVCAQEEKKPVPHVAQISTVGSEESAKNISQEKMTAQQKPDEVSKDIGNMVTKVTARDDAFQNMFQPGRKTEQKTSTSSPGIAEIKAFVDKSRLTVGEQVKYTVEVDALKTVKASFPPQNADFGGFTITKYGEIRPAKSGPNKICVGKWYLFKTFTVGPYVIPAQTVTLELPNGDLKTLKTPEIYVEVVSVMQKNEKEELRDIKPPLAIPGRFPVGILIPLVLGVAVLGAIGYAVYYIRNPRKKTPPPELLPHERALEELSRIERMDLVRKNQIKEYYYLVSSCLRRYLEDRFALRAPEQTTEEFLERIIAGGPLVGRQINLLKEYLTECDLVKYAKFEPENENVAKLIQTTRAFIEETKPLEKIEAQP